MSYKNKTLYKDLIAFHPGSYVEEIIEDLNISQKDFAQRLGTTEKSLSKLVNGEDKLSDELALKLSKLTGISLNTWLNLQKQFDAKILEIQDKKTEEEEEAICRQIDFSYFKKHGRADDRRYTIKEKIEFLRSLLNISSLSYLTQLNPGISFRNTSQFTEKSIINSNVLMELASNEARNYSNTKLDKRKLRAFLPQIREMTLSDTGDFYENLQKELLVCGVILVALPSLANAQINGATTRFKNGSVMLMISDRNKSADIFWFSLLHELGHILYSHFYSDFLSKEKYLEKENIADDFARNFLIDPKDYQSFIDKRDLSKEAIIKFSNIAGVHPSIILGRLQRDKLLPYNVYKELKINYTISLK